MNFDSGELEALRPWMIVGPSYKARFHIAHRQGHFIIYKIWIIRPKKRNFRTLFMKQLIKSRWPPVSNKGQGFRQYFMASLYACDPPAAPANTFPHQVPWLFTHA